MRIKNTVYVIGGLGEYSVRLANYEAITNYGFIWDNGAIVTQCYKNLEDLQNKKISYCVFYKNSEMGVYREGYDNYIDNTRNKYVVISSKPFVSYMGKLSIQADADYEITNYAYLAV